MDRLTTGASDKYSMRNTTQSCTIDKSRPNQTWFEYGPNGLNLGGSIRAACLPQTNASNVITNPGNHQVWSKTDHDRVTAGDRLVIFVITDSRQSENYLNTHQILSHDTTLYFTDNTNIKLPLQKVSVILPVQC